MDLEGIDLNQIIPNLLDREEWPSVSPEVVAEFGVVLVTGAGGSIGSRIVARLLELGASSVIALDHSELSLYNLCERSKEGVIPILGSVLDKVVLHRVMTVFKVKTVFHVAAYKHVPMVERNPLVGVTNNFIGTVCVADVAEECGVSNFLLVSTDKAVNPTNIMGASKRLAEMEILSRNGKTIFSVVRFGNVMWSTGSVLPLFYRQLSSTKELTITHKGVSRYFMSIPEAVELTLYSIGLGRGVFVFDMGQQILIEQIAIRLAKYLKVEDYTIKYVGLRPGEKLFEELSLGGDLQSTSIERIKSASIGKIATSKQRDCIKLCLSRGDVASLRESMKEIVEGYSPSCGIVDSVWLEEYVSKGVQELDDCFREPLIRV